VARPAVVCPLGMIFSQDRRCRVCTRAHASNVSENKERRRRASEISGRPTLELLHQSNDGTISEISLSPLAGFGFRLLGSPTGVRPRKALSSKELWRIFIFRGMGRNSLRRVCRDRQNPTLLGRSRSRASNGHFRSKAVLYIATVSGGLSPFAQVGSWRPPSTRRPNGCGCGTASREPGSYLYLS